MVREIKNAIWLSGHIGKCQQIELVEEMRAVARLAPMFHPETRFGKKMSVRMTSAGRFGWVSDRRGYRYQAHHPGGAEWPPIPALVNSVWHEVTKLDRKPDSCLINYYSKAAKMGLHQDRDEASFDWPVVSISLGDDALFRIGGLDRRDPTESFWLSSGDVVVLQGESRLAYHGVDRVRFGSSRLLEGGGRLNLTLRVVD